jgi:hypothetical protein
MKTGPRGLLLACAMTIGCWYPAAAARAATWGPLDGVNELVVWFTRLNSQFDTLVVAERRGQLEHSVDHLRTALYGVELDSQKLLDSVPDERPEGTKKNEIEQLDRSLMTAVNELGASAREVGADLRLNDGVEIEARLTSGLHTRALALSGLQKMLDSAAPWDAKSIRGSLAEGLRAIHDAQLATTEFRVKLDNLH